MEGDKSAKRSISMPQSYWDAIDGQIGPGGTVSGWVQDAAAAALRAAGAFPDNPADALIARVRAIGRDPSRLVALEQTLERLEAEALEKSAESNAA
jgi:hypothetical protein